MTQPATTTTDGGGGALSYNQIDTTLGAGTSSSTKNPNDVWGLGALYGQPIALGMEQTTTDGGGGSLDYNNYKTAGQHLDLSSQTQDIFSGLNQMWAQQAQERKQDPSGLTGYEQIQQELWQAGYFGQTSFDRIHLGQWDTSTQDALKKALKDYEGTIKTGTPMTWSEFLDSQAQAAKNAPGGFYGPSGSGKTKTPKAPSPLQLVNSADLVASVQKAAEDALGHTLTKAQAEKFAAHFHAEQEQQYQLALGQAQGQTANATFQSNPFQAPASIGTQAAQYAAQQDPQGYQDQQIQAYTNAFMNMFLPGGSGRANMAVDPIAGAVAQEPMSTPPPQAPESPQPQEQQQPAAGGGQ